MLAAIHNDVLIVRGIYGLHDCHEAELHSIPSSLGAFPSARDYSGPTSRTTLRLRDAMDRVEQSTTDPET